MLVPVQNGSDAQTRYDVQYPQHRGALPPGMELPYEEGAPIPPGYHVVSQKKRGLIIAGSIVTGVPWVFGVMGAVGSNFDNNSGLLLIPVVGPWAMLATNATRSCSSSDPLCSDSKAGMNAVLVFDGIVQTAGGIMFAVGMFSPRLRLIRNDVVVSVLPTSFGQGRYGLGAIGTF
jgi:hypothetical protein